MRGLSICQPWGSLIVHGFKDVENRDWAAPRYMIGQRFAVHTSKKLDAFDVEDAVSVAKHNGLTNEDLSRMMPWPTGSIIGTVKLLACVDEVTTDFQSPWFFGRYGFVLGDPRPLVEPIPIRGALGFWTVPAEIEAQLKAVEA